MFLVPNPVLNLVASPVNSTSVEVMWSYPQDAQRDYTYLVQARNDIGVVFNATVNENSTEISNLEPGTRYNISVKAIASAGSESTEEHTYSYTSKYLQSNIWSVNGFSSKTTVQWHLGDCGQWSLIPFMLFATGPTAVTGLHGKYVTTTSIQLTWDRQEDHKSTYSYLVIARQGANVVQNYSTNAENHTFFSLTPGALYTFDVFTVVGGVSSSQSSISISTSKMVKWISGWIFVYIFCQLEWWISPTKTKGVTIRFNKL